MYHRALNILIITQDVHLDELIRNVQPQDRFSHKLITSVHPEASVIGSCAIVIVDFEGIRPDALNLVYASVGENSSLIGCLAAGSVPALAESPRVFDQIWFRPLDEGKVRASFIKVLAQMKEREDARLVGNYLDTLIDNLPNLIWFKDAMGSHLRVNNSFCRAVNKTREQVEGRGHYYIWDIEPEDYAQGEYICLESEEIVLAKKETCLFDEVVKFGGEFHKFKTYKSPIFDTDGEVMGTVGFANDVTDLQNLIIEMNIIIESLPFAVMVMDKDRKITSVNQRYIDTFLLDRDELIGRRVDSLIDESKLFTKSKRWAIEMEGEHHLLLSKEKVLRVHEEDIVDTFGAYAGFIYIFVDVTLEHQRKNKLLIDANTDHLTGLNNRRSLQDFMRKTPCRVGTALLLADLDNFKEVNDRHGHEEGDKVLVAFAALLQDIFPPENLFRLGGDEFAVILHDMESPIVPNGHAELLLRRFGSLLAREFSHTDVSVSIGISMDVDDHNDFGELFKQADMALYESKSAGKSAYTFWKR